MSAHTPPSFHVFVRTSLACALCATAGLAQVAGPRPGSGGAPQPQGQQKPAATYDYTAMPSRYVELEPFDRYGRRRAWNPLTMSDGTGEYPILRGAGLFDVYNTNKWKGDRPVIGENTFFAAQAVWNNLFESRDKVNDSADELRSTLFLTADFFHGDTVFRPPTWRVRTTLALDVRDADDVDNGETQGDGSVQELFGELLLWEMDPYLDFGSIRVGRQAFASDFRNFIFQDNNDGVLLFGSLFESRVDWEIGFFDLAAKDPFSNLNRGFEQRDQQFWVANVFVEDVLAMGYEMQFSLQGVSDSAGFTDLRFTPPFAPGQIERDVDVYYLGFNGEGRIGDLEVAHAFYWMTGKDTQNQFAGQEIDVSAQMAALEIALPWDWRRYVFSVLYASGDGDPNDGKGEAFDSVFDNPAFAGGAFGFWNRQGLNTGNIGDAFGNGRALTNTNSIYPNLRQKAFEGPNSVNPGLFMLHGGCEAVLSNYWTVAANAAYLSFVDTAVLEQFSGVNSVGNGIGFDFSLAAQYRPLGVDNCIITPGIQVLVPVDGFKDLSDEDALFALFVNAVVVL